MFSACAAACTSAAYQATKSALIFTSNALLGKALADYIQLTIPARCIPLSSGGMQLLLTPDMMAGHDLCLIVLQPVLDQPFFDPAILNLPQVRQIMVLQVTWLGRKILPEWQFRPGQRPAPIAGLRNAVKQESGWSYRETAVGSLASLGWGFLSGHLLAANLPDLADQFYARMRYELLPTRLRSGLKYLCLAQISRQTLDCIS